MTKLKEIPNILELADFLPALCSLHQELDGKWEDELDETDFFIKLLSNFSNDSRYFGDFDESGNIKYFIAVLRQESEIALFWLFYMNPDYRTETRGVLDELRQFLNDSGYREVRFSSTRITKSYQRWVEKFGAEPYEIIYKLKL